MQAQPWFVPELIDARTDEGREDVKDQLPRRARRIDETIANGPKANTAIAQFLDKLDQVVHRASKSV